METISFGQVIRRTWCDAWGFVKCRPGLTLGVAALALLCALMSATTMGGPVGHAASLGDAGRQILRGLLHLFLGLADGALKVGLLVQVSRYVLLGERTSHAPFFGSGFWRYLLVLIAGMLAYLLAIVAVACLGALLALLMGVSVHAIHAGHALGLTIIVVIAMGLAMIVVSVLIFAPFTLLLSQATAARKLSLGAARRDARGHAWSIATALFVASLPVMLLSIPVVVEVLSFASTVAHGDLTVPSDYIYVAVPAQALLGIIGTLVNGACAAWLYRRYANQLLPA